MKDSRTILLSIRSDETSGFLHPLFLVVFFFFSRILIFLRTEGEN